MSVEVVQSDRGGDITFHGPGQLVAYPIVRLSNHGLMVGSYVRCLLEVVVATLADFGIPGQLDRSAIGVWVPAGEDKVTATPAEGAGLAKICALGVRIRRGISMHGIALNVTTDLRYFNLIVPCGLSRPVTSMHVILKDRTPSMEAVKQSLISHMQAAFSPIPAPSRFPHPADIRC
jgi:lipoyl(octanoyl) transferase